MGTYLWVLDVYNRRYTNLNRSWDNYITEPYASNISSLGALEYSVPDSLLNRNPQLLFQPAFVSGILDGNDQDLIGVLEENSVVNWNPKAPVFLFHGSEDDFVFPIISENAFESLQNNGANIKYQVLEDKNHVEAEIPFYTEVLKSLKSL